VATATATAVDGRPRSAAERLGVSLAPPPTYGAAPAPVMTMAVSESIAAWSSDSVVATANGPKRKNPIFSIIFLVAFLVVAAKGGMVGYQYAMKSVKPAAFAEGDCINFDAQGAKAHVASCAELHWGRVVKQVAGPQACAGISPIWITKDGDYYCVQKG
jgi:hypothetical protein